MKKTLLGAMLCAMTGIATAQESVLQLFACHLNEGKTMENVWQTLEMLGDRATTGAAEQDPGFGIFLWQPHRGSLGYDFAWGVTSSDLVSMAEGTAGYYSSGNAETMAPRFADLGTCNSSISFTEQLSEGVIGTTADRELDAIVETFSCQFRDGADFDDVRNAAGFWQEQIAKIDSEALSKYEGFLLRPFRGIRQGLDFAWIGTSPDIVTWAQGSTDYYSSKPGQDADARFQRVSTCQSQVWTGFWIVAPQNGT